MSASLSDCAVRGHPWRLFYSPVPESFKGFPIALVTAGLMSIAFLGFARFNLSKLFGM